MLPLGGRRAIGRGIVAAVIVVVLIGAGVVAYVSTSSTSPPTSATSTTSIIPFTTTSTSASYASTSATTSSLSSLASDTTATTTSTSSSSLATTESTASSSTLAPPGLAVDDMEDDVVGPGFVHLEDNETSVDGEDIYIAYSVGDSLGVEFDIVYAGCNNDCPSQVINVTTNTPGWSITGTNPGFPIPIDNPPGADAGQVEFHFIVDCQAPFTTYNGPLELTAYTQ